MKISEIKIVREICVAIPQNDAYRIIQNEKHRASYIAQYGDVDVVLNQYGRYDVEAFAEGRASYTAAKAADCAIWGCE